MMESEGGDDEGRKLAEVVKETHRLLRTQYKEAGGGTQAGADVWREHLGHEEHLHRYARAMHTLATQHWPSDTQAGVSRVSWVRAAIKDYYWGGGLTAATEKEMRKLQHLGLAPDQPHSLIAPPADGTIRVLDVGSCYNPFQAFPELEVMAIDLCPAHESVLKGDFLNLEIVEKEGERPGGGGEEGRGRKEEEEEEERQQNTGNRQEERETEGEEDKQRTEEQNREGTLDKQRTEEKDKQEQRTAEQEEEGCRRREKQGEWQRKRGTEEEEQQKRGTEEQNREQEEGRGEVDTHRQRIISEREEGVGDTALHSPTSSLTALHSPANTTCSVTASRSLTTTPTSLTALHSPANTTSSITASHSLTTTTTITASHSPDSTVSTLSASSFDAVVLSLVLEYLPAPTQRRECCRRAWQLLAPGGLLVIVTPDSRHQGANAHLYQLWRVTLAGLGFGRIKYDKRPHFHGLVFRRGLCRAAWQGDAARFLRSAVSAAPSVRAKLRGIDYSRVDREMYISQDFDNEGVEKGDGRRKRKMECAGQEECKRGRKEHEEERGERDENKSKEGEMNGRRGRTVEEKKSGGGGKMKKDEIEEEEKEKERKVGEER